MSHPGIYTKLVVLLSIFTLAECVFSISFSMWLTQPSQTLLIASVVSYYIGLLIWLGFFIYISPGLLDPVNGILKYQFVMYSAYTLLLIAYPILFYTLVEQKTSEDDTGSGLNSHSQLFDQTSQQSVLVIYTPLMLVLCLHLFCVIWSFMCKCERKAETFLLITLLTIVFLEFYASELKANRSVDTINQSTLPSVIILCLLLLAWILLYIILF